MLVSKKRYVGMAHEEESDAAGHFDAKGIEVVRRDNCPAVGKMQEKALRLLFATKDASLVKSWLLRQWTKLLSHRVRPIDYVFAKEVTERSSGHRGGGGTASCKSSMLQPRLRHVLIGRILQLAYPAQAKVYRGGPPAHAVVNYRAAALDPRARALYGERVPYLVVHPHDDSRFDDKKHSGSGAGGAGGGLRLPRLMDMVVDPRQVLEPGSGLQLNGFYYLHKQILPALARVLNIAGLDPHRWLAEMPRPRSRRPVRPHAQATLRHLRGLGFFVGGGGGGGGGGGFGGGLGLGGGVLRQKMLTSYLLNECCLVCDARCRGEVCNGCSEARPWAAPSVALARLGAAQATVAATAKLCGRCLRVNDGGPWASGVEHNAAPICAPGGGGASEPVAPDSAPWRPLTAAACSSVDCPVLFKRASAAEDLAAALDLAYALKLLE